MNNAQQYFRRENDTTPQNNTAEHAASNRAFFRCDTEADMNETSAGATGEQETSESDMSHARLRSADATSASTRDAEHLRSIMTGNGKRNKAAGYVQMSLTDMEASTTEETTPDRSDALGVQEEVIPFPGPVSEPQEPAAGYGLQDEEEVDQTGLSAPGPITLGGLQKMKHATRQQDTPVEGEHGETIASERMGVSSNQMKGRAEKEDPLERNLRGHSGIPPTERSGIPPYDKGAFEPFEVTAHNNRLKSFGGWLAIAAGLGIAILLYGGGADFLSGVFGNENEGIAMDETGEVVESNIVVGTLEPEEPPPGFGVDIDAAPAASSEAPVVASHQPKESVAIPVRSNEEQNIRALPVAHEEAPVATQNQVSERETLQAEPVAERVHNTDEVEAGGSYSVQVSATSDKDDAEQIAAKLRSKGLRNVKVLSTEKDGSALYRIRFGSFPSKDAALTAAGKAGYHDVWVAKQK